VEKPDSLSTFASVLCHYTVTLVGDVVRSTHGSTISSFLVEAMRTLAFVRVCVLTMTVETGLLVASWVTRPVYE